jgi:hypothetical protein
MKKALCATSWLPLPHVSDSLPLDRFKNQMDSFFANGYRGLFGFFVVVWTKPVVVNFLLWLLRIIFLLF